MHRLYQLSFLLERLANCNLLSPRISTSLPSARHSVSLLLEAESRAASSRDARACATARPLNVTRRLREGCWYTGAGEQSEKGRVFCATRRSGGASERIVDTGHSFIGIR